jgi:NADPH-dependent curcumin reductase CurA
LQQARQCPKVFWFFFSKKHTLALFSSTYEIFPMTHNRRFLLMRRPNGMPVADDFALVSEAMPDLQDGQILVRNHYVSLDPAMRGWMDDRPSYIPPIKLGTPMKGATVGVVAASKASGIAEGQWVYGFNAIEEYSVVDPGAYFKPIDVSIVDSPTNYLSVLGAAGMTAYFGYLDVCQPKPGDVVLVTGAAGAVGSLVGQIARIKGASKVIGIAGGPEKCRRLLDHYGFDTAIDYRSKCVDALTSEIRAAAPGGLNIIFENVGGDILDAGLNNLALRARVGICGLISEYNNAGGKTGARNIWQLIVSRATMQGLLVADYVDRFPEGIADMAAWLKAGKLRFDEHIEHGIENCLPAFLRLFSGDKDGKLLLKLIS